MAIELAKPRVATSAGRFAAWLSLRLGRPRLRARERMYFTERLALLLAAGSPLHAALEVLGSQAGTPALATLAANLREDVSGGLSFAEALAKYPEAFSTTYVNLIAAAERGGFISEVLERIAAMEERNARLQASVLAAFSYPAFLVVFSTGVVIFVLTVVFPKFQKLFAAIVDQLPATTLALMWLSRVLREHWAVVFAGAALLGFAAFRWLASPAGGAAIDRLKLAIPGLRDLFVWLYLSQILRVASLSLGHDVGVVGTLRACRDVVHNHLFRNVIRTVEAEVEEGRGLASGFERSPIIPLLAKQMIATGEESGNLPLVMERLADHYERELERRLTLLAKLVEPIMLVVMGAVVGVIVASLILPIFKLSRAVR